MAKQVAVAELVEGPWALPDGWRWEALGSFVSKGGASVTPAKTPNEAFEIYSVPSHSTGYPETLAGREIGSSKQSVAPGDVLLCKINPRINRVWKVVDHGTGRLIASTEWIRFAGNDVIDPDYLRYFLMRQEVRDYLAMNASGVGGSLMRVRPSVVEPIPFPVAPQGLQRCIVARIDELFAEIDDGEAALVRARDDLATWRKALLKAAVTGELTADWRAANPPAETGADLLARILAERRARWHTEPKNKGKRYSLPISPKISSLPPLPASWEWATIDQLSTRVTKGSSPGWQGFEYQGEGILFVRSQNVGWGRLLLEERVYLDAGFNAIESKAIVQEGDVLLNIVGASIGRACKADTRLEGANTNQAVAGIRPVSSTLSDWIVAWLVSPAGQAVVFANVVETARANISLEQVRAIPIPLPPECERGAVLASCHQSIDAQAAMIAEVEVQVGAAATLRQSILAAAFHGELV